MHLVDSPTHIPNSHSSLTTPAKTHRNQTSSPFFSPCELYNASTCQTTECSRTPGKRLCHIRDQFRTLFVFSGSRGIPGTQWPLDCSLEQTKKKPQLSHGGPDRTWVRYISIDLSPGSGARELGYRASHTNSLVRLWGLNIWKDPGTRKTPARATTVAFPQQ